ncbi:transglycosylase SLT domain-containing protein [Streptomyces sp. NPDC049627]|uniref:transglycosylase SLT domain-containing protein n=1 Tax=Streptomyces sp. NPDC049627 TaxID=3365595 RepID=UPI0037A098EB
MLKNTFNRGHSRALTKRHKIAIAGVATLGAAAIAISAVPGNAETTTAEAPAGQVAYSSEQIKDVKGSVTDQLASDSVKTEQISAKHKAAVAAAKHRAAEAHDKHVAAEAAAKKKAAEAAAKRKAEAARKAKEAASRSAQRVQVKPVAAKTYANNLDGWIRESLDIMKKHGIPGSYNGIYRNVMRESSGNPNAINNWDINAINGIPSKGLLQVIPPTFSAYHVPGTSWNIYDPVANITAACNYAADKYGSMDNVNSAY